jgi:hypothetical protein
MRHVTPRALLSTLLGLLASSVALAIPVQTGTDLFTLNIDANLQLRFEESGGGPVPTNPTAGPAAPSGHWNLDIFFRRASLSIRGTAFQDFTYYLKLETGKFGARGNYSTSTQIQDAYIGYVPFTEFNIEGGFLKTPLSRPAVDSSWRANSLEGVSDILLYPNTRAQRQMGAQVRGLLVDRRLLIRGGIYEGARNGFSGGNPANPTTPATNPNGWPMLAGMARVNLIGWENPYTYPGIYLDGISRASVGAGAQYQASSGAVNRNGTISDYTAYSADAFADIALPGNSEAVLILDGYRFDYGAGAQKTGYGAHGEIGFRWGPIEPTASSYWFNSETKTNSFLRWTAGLTYFIRGHQAKVMFEYEQTIMNGTLPNTPNHVSTPWLHQFLLQVQLHP